MRDAAHAGTSERISALNKISEDIAAQREWGSEGGTQAAQIYNNLIRARDAQSLAAMGGAGGLAAQAAALGLEGREFGLSGLHELYSGVPGESTFLINTLRDTINDRAGYGLSNAGLRVQATPEPWWKSVLGAAAGGAATYFSGGRGRTRTADTGGSGGFGHGGVY